MILVNEKFNRKFSDFITSRFYMPTVIAVALLFYATKIDVVGMIVLSAIFALALLFTDNERYAMPPMFCMLFVLSFRHAMEGDKLFYTSVTSIICFAITAVFVIGGLVLYLIKVRPLRHRSFSFKKSKTLISTAIMTLSMTTAGFFHSPFDWGSMMYGFGIGIMFVVAYLLFSFIFDGSEQTRVYMAQSMVALLVLLMCELALFYAVRFHEFGTLSAAWKGIMNLGWGISNTCGALMVMLISAAYYLIYKNKNVTFNYCVIFLAINAVYFTLSRAALLIGFPMVAFLAIFCMIKNKPERKKLLVLTAFFIAIEVTFVAIVYLFGKLPNILDFYLGTTVGGDGTIAPDVRGRDELWKGYFEFFKQAPVFGVGFYNAFNALMNPNMTMFSGMAHNTIMQFLGSCGIIGILAYVYHRFTTVKIIVKNFSLEKFIFACGIAALVLMSLFDVFFTVPYFVIFYELYVVFCEKHDQSEPEQSIPEPEQEAKNV